MNDNEVFIELSALLTGLYDPLAKDAHDEERGFSSMTTKCSKRG